MSNERVYLYYYTLLLQKIMISRALTKLMPLKQIDGKVRDLFVMVEKIMLRISKTKKNNRCFFFVRQEEEEEEELGKRSVAFEIRKKKK